MGYSQATCEQILKHRGLNYRSGYSSRIISIQRMQNGRTKHSSR